MNQHLKAVSVKKPETGNMICEDASKQTRDCIVVSDGAGGGGIFADRWAQYLVDNLPETPIATFQDFTEWMEQIWNPFYTEYEKVAQEHHCTTKSVDAEAVDALCAMPWTGNIRELRNVVERLMILSGESITLRDVELYC